MLGRSRVASHSRGSSVIQSSWCSSIPVIVTLFGHMEEGGGVKKGLWDLFPFNTSHQPQLEPTFTKRVITSARSTGAQDCVDLLLPVGAECRVQLQDHLSGFGITSKWDSEKTEIHTPISNSTKGQWPSLPPPAVPSPGSCNGMVDSPGRWQRFRPTGGSDRSWSLAASYEENNKN